MTTQEQAQENVRVYATKYGDITFTLWGKDPKNLDVPYRATASFGLLRVNGIVYHGDIHLDYRKGYWSGADEEPSWHWRVESAYIRRANFGAPTDQARRTLYLVTREALDAWQSDAPWLRAGARFQLRQEIQEQYRDIAEWRQKIATALDVIARKQDELAAL